MKEIPAQYSHQEIEKKWQKYWQDNSTYKWDNSEPRENNFVIDTPPPTVSGLLHMGHVFSYTQADFIARFQRMKGKNVFYPMGFDDNGLPTERLVEKVKGIRARNIDRAEFRKLCMEVIEDAEKEFEILFNDISISVDWTQKYQTISSHSIRTAQASFLDLYQKNDIYRALEPTLWDPIDQTALAQTDLEDHELAGMMNEIKFHLEDDGGHVHIATTRPELIPACVAVLYNPDDGRYKHLAGKSLLTPIFGIKVPVIADQDVEIEKGTGLVMCCTFGDVTDIDWWRKHKLPTKIILDKAGRLSLKDKFNNPAADRLDGKKVEEARKEMILILEENNLLVAQTPVKRMVKCAERSKAPIEVLITPQWFIKVLDKKQELLAYAEKCNWYPAFMKVRIENWINGLSWDWCISRQRYFGIPFPVWYSKRAGEEGKIIIATPEELPLDPIHSAPKGYAPHEVEPDMDVMDTWATSSVTPQINSHALNQNFAIDYDRHKKLFPADLRPQSHEIIRTWAFGTITKSMLHEGQIPWKNLMISGWVLAADKSKMSKSKGNVVTPHELIKEKSADAIRYWASSSKLGNDIAYSEDMFKIGKKLITKLWNAAKFVSTHLDNDILHNPNMDDITYIVDRWLLSKLHLTIKKATKELESFEYCNARQAIEDFFWNDFCDNYLELIKIRIYDQEQKNLEGKKSAAMTVALSLEVLLKLLAPFLPSITEELYDLIYDRGHSIHIRGNWPDHENIPYDKAAEEQGKGLLDILDVVRKFKTEQQMSMKAPLACLNICADTDAQYFSDGLADLQNVTNAEKVLFNEEISNKLSTKIRTIDNKFEIIIIK